MSSSNGIYTVYQIKNLINFKVYIGITSREPEIRWKAHLQFYTRRKSILYCAMRKYGIENFEFSILEQTNNIETLKELEKKYIQQYNSYCFQESSNGYNMTLGGDGTFGYKHSEDIKKKIGDIQRGRPISKESKLRLLNANVGKPKSIEVKNKISKSHKNMKKPWVAERNFNSAKIYEVIFPDGKIEIIKNLNQFCKIHNLHSGSMSLVSRGLQKDHKKFRCKLIES
jgi:group I intron endonuclease